MSENDLSKEITSAWEEFTKNSEKAKEDIQRALYDETEDDRNMHMGNIILLGVGILVCSVVAFTIYFCIKAVIDKEKKAGKADR